MGVPCYCSTSIILFLFIDPTYSISISSYLNITRAYYTGRNIKILDHFVCFTQYEKVIITKELSNYGYQTRFINERHAIQFKDLYYNFGTIIDLNCDGHHRYLQKASENLWLLPDNFLLLIKSNNDLKPNDFISTYKEYDFSPQSEIIFAINDYSFRPKLLDVYKVSPNESLISTNIEVNYSNGQMNGITQSIQMLLPTTRRRSNLHGTRIKGAYVVLQPEIFTSIGDLHFLHTEPFLRANYPIVVNLRDDLNFSFNLYQVDDYGWYKNGTFNGLMGLFQQRKIYFGALGVMIRIDRLLVIDPTAETFRLRPVLLFRQPRLAVASNIFVLPLAYSVWISIILTMLLAMGIMLFQLIHPNRTVELTSLDSVTFVCGAVCQQGFHLSLSTLSGRIYILTIFICSIALFTSYSANIVSLLQSPSHVIKSLQQLVDSPLSIGIQQNKYNPIYFSETTNPVIKALYEKKIKPNIHKSYMSPEEIVKHIRPGMFAGQIETHAAYKLISDTYTEEEKCGLSELEMFRLPILTVPVMKNCPYKQLFRTRLRWQREIGLMNREFMIWLPRKPKCNVVGGFVSVGLIECRPALKLLGYGLAIAIFIFSIENCYFHVTRRFVVWNSDGYLRDTTLANNLYDMD